MKTLSHYNKTWCRVIALLTTLWVFAASDTTTAKVQKNDEVCNYRGDLYEFDGHFQCRCEDGYRGTICQSYIPCITSPCVQGNCGDNGNGSFVCDCFDGWTGHLCDTDIDECASQPCQYGNCTDGVGRYDCVCEEQYNGTNCDLYKLCNPSPCRYGTCEKNGTSGFFCICKRGYTGELCDKDINECDSSPCQHGTCRNKRGYYRCRCDVGYHGTNCDKDKLCNPSPCVSGNCSNDGKGGFTCGCDAGYTGELCDTLSTTERNTPASGQQADSYDSSENAKWWGIGVASGVAMAAAAYASVKGIQYLMSKTRSPLSHVKTSHMQKMRYRTNRSTRKGDSGEDGNKDGDDISLGSMPSIGSNVFLLGRYTDFITTEVTIRDSIYVKRHTETLDNVQPARRPWCPIVEPLI